MAATSPTRAGLEGAGQGPSAVYTGNRGCQVAHNPSSAAEHFRDWALQHKGRRPSRTVGGLEALRRRGFCSPGNPESWAKQRSMSRQNLARMTLSTP